MIASYSSGNIPPGGVPRKHLRHALLIVIVALGALVAFFVFGCASKNLTAPAKVHQTVTMAISDSCTAALQAEQLYNTGKIPQTEPTRKAINAAGAACEDAKAAFTLSLQAEQSYIGAQSVQVNACADQTSAVCVQAQSNTAAAKAKVTATADDLNAKVSTLVTATQTVKALTPQ
jgi:hypothetical protein